MHSHECRDCGGDIECDGVEGRNGCLTWNGSNDGCECAPHNLDCRGLFRCVACYPTHPVNL
jgi:hypothetical protein